MQRKQLVQFIFDKENENRLQDLLDFIENGGQAAWVEPEEQLTEEQLTHLQKSVSDFHDGRRSDLVSHDEVIKKYDKWL